jgi:hypothetical protein
MWVSWSAPLVEVAELQLVKWGLRIVLGQQC